MRHLLEDPASTPTAIEQLRAGGDGLFVKVYKLYREDFIKWGRSHSVLNEQDLEDVFQDTLIVLFKKLHVIDSTNSIVGFLWQTFKFGLYHKYRERVRFKFDVEINDTLLRDWDDSIYQKTNNDHLKYFFSAALQKIGDPCKKILDLLFYKMYAPEAVAAEMGYKNRDVVYSKTHQCLERARGIVKDKI